MTDAQGEGQNQRCTEQYPKTAPPDCLHYCSLTIAKDVLRPARVNAGSSLDKPTIG
jgi:hypothetical protein